MNVRFEMRFKCGGNPKVLDPLRAFGKSLTFFDALMAYQTMERFTRLEIQTFSYCVGANGPRLFIFSGKSPQKVRTPSAVVFLLITSFL